MTKEFIASASIGVNTLSFLIKLKASNVFWYQSIVRCAQESPKLCKECITQLPIYVTSFKDSAEKANVFEVCMAVNSGLASLAKIEGHEQQVWDLQLARILEEYRKELKQ